MNDIKASFKLWQIVLTSLAVATLLWVGVTMIAKDLAKRDVFGSSGRANLVALSSATATSTFTYLTPGAASSTIAFDSEAADLVGLNLVAQGSSTLSNLLVGFQFSNDQNDWFNYNCGDTTPTDGVITRTDGCVNSWNLATSSTLVWKTLSFNFFPIASKYARLVLGASGANAGVWSQIILRHPRN